MTKQSQFGNKKFGCLREAIRHTSERLEVMCMSELPAKTLLADLVTAALLIVDFIPGCVDRPPVVILLESRAPGLSKALG